MRGFAVRYGITFVALAMACAEVSPKQTIAKADVQSVATTQNKTHDAWWLKVCPRQTEAAAIEFHVGTDAQHTATVTWKSGDPGEIAVPSPYQTASPLFVDVLVPDHHIAHICVLDAAVARKEIVTDSKATVTVPKTSTDACACFKP